MLWYIDQIIELYSRTERTYNMYKVSQDLILEKPIE